VRLLLAVEIKGSSPLSEKLYSEAVEDAEHQLNGVEKGWDIINAVPGSEKVELSIM
jgi:hypothetical protein